MKPRFFVFAFRVGAAGMLLAATLSLRAQPQGAWANRTSATSPALSHHGMTYDSARHRLLVAGQENWETVVVFAGAPDGTWTRLPSPEPAPHGDDLEIAYDAARDVAVLYTNDGNKVWELSGDTWELKEAETPPVQCSDGALLKYDPVRQKIVLVGCDGWPEPDKPSETWLWDGVNWTRAAGPRASPRGAAGGAMAFDAARGEMVLVAMTRMTTWTFDGATWTKQTPATLPEPGVWVAGMAYHPPLRCCVLYGGEHVESPDSDDPILTYPTRAWAWDGANWVPVATTGNAPPNIDFGFAWFPEQDALIMHGGWGPDSDWQPRNAVWALTLAAGPPAGDIRFTSIRWLDAHTLELVSTGGGGAGRTQTLQAAGGVGPGAVWTDLESRANPPAENTWQVPAEAAAAQRFFRIVETP